jgi:hypothetical protein
MCFGKMLNSFGTKPKLFLEGLLIMKSWGFSNIIIHMKKLVLRSVGIRMKHNIFISYASNDTDIVENLRGRFNDIGVRAWVYSRDRTFGEEAWKEIEEKIINSDVVIFVVSQSTVNANGQQKELDLVLKKVEHVAGTSKIIPLFINGADPSHYPDVLRNKNGDFLASHNVKTVAWRIAKHAFPLLFKNKSEEAWNCPIPGSWLMVSNLDRLIEKYFNVGDKLYFRAISPMGLFECYAPNIQELFWIAPENVQLSLDFENDKELEKSIPRIYTVGGIVDIQMLGWDAWHEKQKSDE